MLESGNQPTASSVGDSGKTIDAYVRFFPGLRLPVIIATALFPPAGGTVMIASDHWFLQARTSDGVATINDIGLVPGGNSIGTL